MTQPTPERLGPVTSLNDERLAALRALAPELFSADDDGVNPDALLAFFGLADQPRKRESFGLDWVGKHAAILAAGLPATHTLVPEELTDSKNLILEGDNLEVMRVLRKSYANKIKLIYIDPPYNTGNDFVYPDNFATHENDYLRKIGAISPDGTKQSINTRSDGRFHAKWLNMMYPRLVLARELLRDDGVIFVSIDDNEVHHLRAIMNEIFGEENFVAQIIWQKIHSTKNDAKYFSDNHEYVICFSRNISNINVNLLDRTSEMDARYTNPDNDPRGPWSSGDLVANETRKDGNYEITGPTGRIFTVPADKHWVYSRENMLKLIHENGVYFGKNGDAFPRKKRYLSEVQQGKKPDTIWSSTFAGHNQEGKREINHLFENQTVFDTPKPSKLIQNMIQLISSSTNDDIILDFFAGSGTTAQAVFNQNTIDGGLRSFILVQFPEQLNRINPGQKSAAEFCESIGKPLTIAEITKERVRRAATKIRNENPLFAGDFGFSSFKIAPSHIVDLPKTIVDDPSQLMNLVFHERLVEQWTPDGLCAELLLREGFALTTPYTTIGDWRCYVHDNGVSLYLNVERKTSAAELVRVLEGRDRDGKRKRNGVAICLDGALTNAELQHLHEHVFLKTV
jgi:adenine-specific DNA-methyltransferase